jgi:NADPH-dependent 2,4-dienoyl-CoA reductase/sulfur reductase-like enzyme
MELVMVGGGETKLGSARVAAERGVDAVAMDFAENDDGERSLANGNSRS